MNPIVTALCIVGIVILFGAYLLLAALLGMIHDAAEVENAELEAGRDG